MSDEYYILSKKHTRRSEDFVTWWGHDRCGYVYSLDNAGIYSKEEAESLCEGGHMSSIPVKVEDAKKMSAVMVYKTDAVVKLLYEKVPCNCRLCNGDVEFNYHEDSRPADQYCDACGELQ